MKVEIIIQDVKALTRDAQLLRQLEEVSQSTRTNDSGYAFTPKPGKLIDLLNLLRDHGIQYRTEFDIGDEF